jgi:hypothetical protein
MVMQNHRGYGEPPYIPISDERQISMPRSEYRHGSQHHPYNSHNCYNQRQGSTAPLRPRVRAAQKGKLGKDRRVRITLMIR